MRNNLLILFLCSVSLATLMYLLGAPLYIIVCATILFYTMMGLATLFVDSEVDSDISPGRDS